MASPNSDTGQCEGDCLEPVAGLTVMGSPMETGTAEQYRDKAREMDALADAMSEPSVRDCFRDLARQYQALARQMDKFRD